MSIKLNNITESEPRSLPIVLLLDRSSSMAGDKIESLNHAVYEMLEAFAEFRSAERVLKVAVITFGGGVDVVHPLQPAAAVLAAWKPLAAEGGTPMAGALRAALDLISLPENRRRAYHPNIVMISDGYPTAANWQQLTPEGIMRVGIEEFDAMIAEFNLSSEGAAAHRFALAIGGEASDADQLRKLMKFDSDRVFLTHEARGIVAFLQWVTRVSQKQSVAKDPNAVTVDDSGPADSLEDMTPRRS